jgi:hypothetical protein
VDDRDKDLTHLFVRDLDEIPLPPRGEWRRAQGRETIVTRSSRYLLTAGAIVAVLALALILGSQLNLRQQTAAGPSSSPRPSPSITSLPNLDPRSSTSPTASPCLGPCGPTGPASSAPAGGPSYNDDFGFVLTEPGAGRTTTIRAELGSPLGSFDQDQFAVSPDGRQIAWFTPFGAQPQQLRIASAADFPTSQVLRTIGAAERGGPIVWSNDASGLLYQTYTVEPAPSPPSPPVNPALYVVHTFDVRGTTTPDRVVLSSPIRGLVLQPIAWDRAANVAAVVETGEGGFMGSYDVIRFTGSDAVTTKTAAPVAQVLAFSVRASSDAKLVLGPTFANGGSLLWWPIADFSAGKTITGALSGFWRPQTHEVATVGGCAGDPACGPNGGVRLLNVDTAASRIAYGLTTANMNLRVFRADGSALIVYAPQAPGANMYDYTLVPLSGAPPITFKDVNGLLASVRLR